jgi:hypothetical protein
MQILLYGDAGCSKRPGSHPPTQARQDAPFRRKAAANALAEFFSILLESDANFIKVS